MVGPAAHVHACNRQHLAIKPIYPKACLCQHSETAIIIKYTYFLNYNSGRLKAFVKKIRRYMPIKYKIIIYSPGGGGAKRGV